MMPAGRVLLLAAGGYLPARIVSNDELARQVDTSDAWIEERTGIRERRIAAASETCVHMASKAAREALSRAGLAAADLDLIVLATATPDQAFPAAAVRVQAALGANRAYGFDITAACSGFIYALSVADALIRAGQARTGLVIGSEVYSRILDWTDRNTCVLFGDGAGAVVLRAATEADDPSRGILSTHLHSDGRLGDLLDINGAVGRPDLPGTLRMNGREVFRHAVAKLSDSVGEALAAHHLPPDAIDWLVPHQANRRIIDAIGKRLALPPARVVITVDRHANTSAASIPLALAEAIEDGRLRPGQLLLLEALGGGLTWGSALVRL